MLAIFPRRSRRAAAGVRRRSALALECLEGRDCPSAPVITLQTAVLANHYVQLSGTVTADDPSSVLVSFSGAATGSVATDSTGHYSLATSNASLGSVTAVGVDGNNQSSSPVTGTIAVDPPSVTLSVAYGAGHSVTLSGRVTDIDAAGRTVTFSGVVTGSVVTNTDGTYSYTATASGLGTVSSSTTDLWAQASNQAQASVANAAPQIINFSAAEEQGVNTWTFKGQVVDESPAGLTVRLGGLASLQGVTVTVANTGWFTKTIDLRIGEHGTATAVTTDWWGLDSNTATTQVGLLLPP